MAGCDVSCVEPYGQLHRGGGDDTQRPVLLLLFITDLSKKRKR
jgi:hypothetical protein